jgi:hypothetical protein
MSSAVVTTRAKRPCRAAAVCAWTVAVSRQPLSCQARERHRGGGVEDEGHPVAQVGRDPSGGFAALLGSDPAHDDLGDRLTAQIPIEIGAGEGVVAGLGHGDLVVAGLEPGQEPDVTRGRVEHRAGAWLGVQDPDDLVPGGA